MVVGRNIRWLRMRAGMTQTDLANRIRLRRRKTDKTYISRLERGRIDPRVSTLRSIARVFGVRPWQLLCDLTDNADWWDAYLRLSAEGKRDAQRTVFYRERRRQAAEAIFKRPA